MTQIVSMAWKRLNAKTMCVTIFLNDGWEHKGYGANNEDATISCINELLARLTTSPIPDGKSLAAGE